MDSKNILSVSDLLSFNEMMLGRGMPNQEDGVGYNKGDYGACSNYFYGLSDAQVADLSKRLVKYSKTQLNMDREIMKDTAEYYASIANGGYNREDGVSVDVTDNGTLIGFKYNEVFVETIKNQPRRQFDGDNKQWVVPNSNAIKTLKDLREVGADVENALRYVENHPLCQEETKTKVDILTKFDGDSVFLKFDYNKDIIDKVKEIEYKDRKWNPEFKFWSIKQKHLNSLKQSLSDTANFRII
jgi:hypothetical protein